MFYRYGNGIGNFAEQKHFKLHLKQNPHHILSKNMNFITCEDSALVGLDLNNFTGPEIVEVISPLIVFPDG